MAVVGIFPYMDRSRYHPERRLILHARDDGMYGIREEYFFQNTDAQGELSTEGWAVAPTTGVFEDNRAARAEIKSRIAKAKRNVPGEVVPEVGH